MLAIPIEQVMSGRITGVRRDKVREFERDDFLGDLAGRLHLEPQIPPVRRRKLDRHVPVKRFEIRPDRHSVLFAQRRDSLHKVRQLLIVNLTILERANVDHLVRLREDSVPVVKTLFERERVLAELLRALRIRRDQHRKVGELLAMRADLLVQLDNVGVILPGFVGLIPTRERLVMPIPSVRFIQEFLVELDLLPIGSSPPEKAAVVSTKKDLDPEFVGKAEEDFADVFVDWQQVRNDLARKNALVAVSRANDDDGVNADLGIQLKLFAPLFTAPILARNIVGDFIQKRASDSKRLSHDEKVTRQQKSRPESTVSRREFVSIERLQNRALTASQSITCMNASMYFIRAVWKSR